MTKQYELWEEFEENRPLNYEISEISDVIEACDAPNEIKESIARLAKSVKRRNPRNTSVVPIEDSVLNYDKRDRLDIMKDRIKLYLGHSTDGMTAKQIYGKYFSQLESEKYRK